MLWRCLRALSMKIIRFCLSDASHFIIASLYTNHLRSAIFSVLVCSLLYLCCCFCFIFFCIWLSNIEIIGTLSKAAYTIHKQKTIKNAVEEYTAVRVRWKSDWNKWETNHIKENEINRAILIVADNNPLKWCRYLQFHDGSWIERKKCADICSMIFVCFAYKLKRKCQPNWGLCFMMWLCWYNIIQCAYVPRKSLFLNFGGKEIELII